MEDIRIGRATGSAPVVVPLTGASQGILPADRKRTAIIFCGPDAGTVRLTIEGIAVAGRGIPLAATDMWSLDLVKHGQLVTRAWNGISAGGAAQMLCLVSTLDQE